MHTRVYKSLSRSGTYLYVPAQQPLDTLPDALRTQLGPWQSVLDLELTPQRRLATEDASTVLQHLATRGYHLQRPPQAGIDPLTADWGTDA